MSNKTIFLDRDNTLIEDPGYINSPDQVCLLEGVAGALVEFKAMGYQLILVTNQSAVARGIVTEKVLAEIHDRLNRLLAEKGARLDRIYYCPYHPEGVVARYRKESDQRKPNPGMLLTAAEELDIDLSRSWMVGNSSSDIVAGMRAGCKTILIDNPSHDNYPPPGEPMPDFRAVNLKEAANIVKKHHRSSAGQSTQTQPAPIDQTVPAIEMAEQPAQSKSTQTHATATAQNSSNKTTEQLLGEILEQLKSTKRAEMFTDFSITRLMAGVVQIFVLFCMLVCIWFLMRPGRQDTPALIALGFAMVFQMMSLTLYIMQERK